MYLSFKNTHLQTNICLKDDVPWVAGDTLPWAWCVTLSPRHAAMATVLDVHFPAWITCFLRLSFQFEQFEHFFTHPAYSQGNEENI